jgi:sterol desaturase/sphingolipid hydroxylase (fatty acid hydroxylase superfamily)
MPTPYELLLDPVSIALFVLYAVLLAFELLRPARVLPPAPGWRLRGLLAFVCYFFVSSYLPLLLSPKLSRLCLLDVRGLGTLASAALLLLGYQLLLYGWHRAMHRWDFLFRNFHQLHHSAERLDVWGAFWFSPLDMVGFTLLPTLALSVLQASPRAAISFVLISTWLSIFQHMNLRTPRWLGYFVQRPESHSWHHARGRHRDNYADLPVVDMLFGTFDNRADFAPELGFYDGASMRLGDMMLGRDVSAPAILARDLGERETAP